MAELGIGLAIAAEQHRIPSGHSQWAGSLDGTVACVWRCAGDEVTCSPLGSGDNFVAVSLEDVVVVGVYFLPRLNREDLEAGLDRVGDFISARLPAPILLAGDFNAKSTLWGCTRPNYKGRILEDWAGTLDLVCLDVGRQSTCI